MSVTSVLAADLDSERVIEAELRPECELIAPLIFRLHAIVNRPAVRFWRKLEHRCERGAGVLRIYINAAGENALVRDVGPAEIKPAFDGQMSFVFDLLRDHFTEN